MRHAAHSDCKHRVEEVSSWKARNARSFDKVPRTLTTRSSVYPAFRALDCDVQHYVPVRAERADSEPEEFLTRRQQIVDILRYVFAKFFKMISIVLRFESLAIRDKFSQSDDLIELSKILYLCVLVVLENVSILW